MAGIRSPGPSSPRLFRCKFSHKSSLVCPCASRLHRLAQNVGNGFVCFKGVVLPARRTGFLSYICSFRVAYVALSGHFEA